MERARGRHLFQKEFLEANSTLRKRLSKCIQTYNTTDDCRWYISEESLDRLPKYKEVPMTIAMLALLADNLVMFANHSYDIGGRK